LEEIGTKVQHDPFVIFTGIDGAMKKFIRICQKNIATVNGVMLSFDLNTPITLDEIKQHVIRAEVGMVNRGVLGIQSNRVIQSITCVAFVQRFRVFGKHRIPILSRV
jgi:hypothetical protein